MKIRKIVAAFVAVLMVISLLPAIAVTAAQSATATTVMSYGWDSSTGAQTDNPYLVSWNNNRRPYALFALNSAAIGEKIAVKATLSFTSMLNNNIAGATTGTIFAIDPDAVQAKTNAALTTAVNTAVANKDILGTVYVGSNGTITTEELDITDYISTDGKFALFLSNRKEDGCESYGISTLSNFSLNVTYGEAEAVSIITRLVSTGGDVVEETSKDSAKVFVGDTYTYEVPSYTVEKDGVIYVYDDEASNLSTTVVTGENSVVAVYTQYDSSNTFSGYEVEDEGAWCWFADPRSITYTNEDGSIDISIVGYIDVHGNIKATQVDYANERTDEVLIRSNIQPDDHNNPTFLVLPDERIIVFYSRHTDEKCFWYRVTEEKGDLTTLGEEKCLVTADATTYPSPFLMENDPDNIYLCWRGIGWHPTIAKLALPDENGDTHFTYGPYQMVQSTAARPYAKYTSNGVDKIYVTYTLGHPDNEQPNWLFFNQINIADMTLEDINSNTLSTIANGTLKAEKNSSLSFIVDDALGNMRDWVWQTTIAEDGKPVIAMVRINGGKTSHDYYYVKWNGTEWVKTFLANGGGSFHQSSGLEMCYSGGMAIDPDNTRIAYCSVPVTGAFGKVYEIVKYTMNEDCTAVESTEQITKNSLKNNVRPFVIPNSSDKDLRLVWMYGDYYDWIVSNAYTTRGYCTAVHSQNPIPTGEVDLSGAIAKEDYSSIGGAFVAMNSTYNKVDASAAGEFSVSADVYMSSVGSVMDLGAVQVSVENIDTQYGATSSGVRKRCVLTVNSSRHVTSNAYGNSDIWTTFSRGTGGNYAISDYENYVNLTVTYDGEYVTLYRDGLIDAKVEASSVTLDGVNIGGFDGYVENVAVYDRVLNQAEINALAAEEYVVEEPSYEGDTTVTCKYQDVLGTVLKDDETLVLPPATTSFKFNPEKNIETKDGYYTLDESRTSNEPDENGVVVAVYVMTQKFSDENLITNGSFEDENGNFSVDGWYSPQSGATLGSPYTTDHFFAITTDKRIFNGVETAATYEIPDGNWALGTNWSDAANGLCSIKRNVSVESGKTYRISFKVRNKVENANGQYLHVSLIANPAMITGDTNAAEEKNVESVGTVGTAWQTYERVFTATDDTDNVLFWFRWLGDSNGPCWFFDDFKIVEFEDVDTATITLDGEEKVTYGEITLDDETAMGYTIARADGEEFVPNGTYDVSDGDVVTTCPLNITLSDGAQVRYGGGVDTDKKVSSGNGIRFIGGVDRRNEAPNVTYGVKVVAEESTNELIIPIEKYQDASNSTFTVAVTDLLKTNYNRMYTATAFATVTYSDDTTETFYSNPVTRSIYQVSAGLLKNGSQYSDYGVDMSDGLYNVLNAYVNMVGIRLTLEDGVFTMRSDGNGAYTGDILFDVSSVNINGGMKVTVTPIESAANKATILGYWGEFIRINNNNSTVIGKIRNTNIENGVLTFDFVTDEAAYTSAED